MQLFHKFGPTINRVLLSFLVSLWLTVVVNFGAINAFFVAPSAGSGFTSFMFALGGLFFILSVIFGFVLFGATFFWRRSIKLWCAIVLISASVLSYFTYFLGTHFDKAMLVGTLQTNPGETLDLLTFRMLLWVLVLGALPSFVVLKTNLSITQSKLRIATTSAVQLTVLIAATAIIVYAMYPRYASATRNRSVTFDTVAPVNFVAASVAYAYGLRALNTTRTPVGQDARQSYPIAKPRLFIFVLGETARAKNHGLNGYERDTTPRMKAAKGFYFANTETCGTATAISVPCIFSGLPSKEFTLEKGRNIETLIDVINHAGARIIWRDNDSGCKGVCAKADYEDFTSAANPRWCNGLDNCFDEILLDGLESKVRLDARDTIVVLHLKGSHGPAYYKRYPDAFERFTPTCKTSDLAACDEQSIRNAYDNTIVYTDHVIGQTVQMLEKLSDQFATALLYVSDHGESLGEGGLFLHGIPLVIAPKEQIQVPMFAWVSPLFISLEKWNRDCLVKQTKVQRSHDNVYSTVLGFLDIDTVQYKKQLDIFEPCDQP
jgi:lipid A ethanolaminephosphotransferase